MMLWTAPALRHQSAKGWSREANHVEGSRPWARLARLVLILRSQCFRCTGLMALARWWCASAWDWRAFRSGRSLAAWIGLVPKQHSTGGKERLGSITKQGNRYLRWLLVAGAMAVIRYARQHGSKRPWLTRIMDRRPAKVVAVALANKIARMAWVIMVHGERYREPKLLLAV